MPRTVASPTLSAAPALSLPRVLLRLEGAAVLIAALALYAHQGWSGVAFAALILAPDLTFAGYLAGAAVGARVYNAAHFYALPLALLLVGVLGDAPAAAQIAAIWFAHIGGDRALGYGFKYATGFKDTHLAHV